jgi:hypothetical protein
MPLVAGHQVVGACRVGALQKLVVAGVLRDPDRARNADKLSMVLDELEELLSKAPPDSQFRSREYLPVFGENGFGDVQPGRFGDRKEQHGALESVRS